MKRSRKKPRSDTDTSYDWPDTLKLLEAYQRMGFDRLSFSNSSMGFHRVLQFKDGLWWLSDPLKAGPSSGICFLDQSPKAAKR